MEHVTSYELSLCFGYDPGSAEAGEEHEGSSSTHHWLQGGSPVLKPTQKQGSSHFFVPQCFKGIQTRVQTNTEYSFNENTKITLDYFKYLFQFSVSYVIHLSDS